MNVLLIDDHALFREGVALLLRPLVDDLTVWEAGSCEAALALTDARGAPDLVLMDLGLPGMSGLDGIPLMRERCPAAPVVALSSADDKDTVLRALDAGAMGFIPKSATSSVLVGALRLILAHGIYLPPSVFLAGRPVGAFAAQANASAVASTPADVAAFGPAAATLAPADGSSGIAPVGLSGGAAWGAAGAAPPVKRPADLGLTGRQAQVLHLLLQGKPAKLIGRELDLSPSTVKAHTSAVLRALNVTTRTQAVIAASRLGLLFQPPGDGGDTAVG